MQYRRIIDLTQPLVPGQGARPLSIERGRTSRPRIIAFRRDVTSRASRSTG